MGFEPIGQHQTPTPALYMHAARPRPHLKLSSARPMPHSQVSSRITFAIPLKVMKTTPRHSMPDTLYTTRKGLLWHETLLRDLSSSSNGRQKSADTKTCAPVRDGFIRIVCKPQKGARAAFLDGSQGRVAAMQHTTSHCILNPRGGANSLPSSPLHGQHDRRRQQDCRRPHHCTLKCWRYARLRDQP